MLIINADDWGRTRDETDRALECFSSGRVSSVSAMVFMEDSERSAELALKSGIDVGLHLNLTEAFSQPSSDHVMQPQLRIARFLGATRYAYYFYNPFLWSAFRCTWASQLLEYQRLYGHLPTHIDGHQHMHLSMNVVFGSIIPEGMKVRRSFTFAPCERNPINRGFRTFISYSLRKRYRLTDYFFCLSERMQNDRIQHVFELAKNQNVELMTHPARQHERAFLMGSAMHELLQHIRVGSYSDLQ